MVENMVSICQSPGFNGKGRREEGEDTDTEEKRDMAVSCKVKMAKDSKMPSSHLVSYKVGKRCEAGSPSELAEGPNPSKPLTQQFWPPLSVRK